MVAERLGRRRGLLVALLVMVGLSCTPLVALADEATPACENESLRSSLNSLALPGCRAYEMVSPPYKEGYPMFESSFSTDGYKAIVFSLADLAGALGAGENASEGDLYADERTPSGWQLSPLNASSSEFVGEVPVSAEAQSGTTLWKQHAVGQPIFVVGLYARSAAGVFSFIGPLNLPLEGKEESGDTMDLSRKRFDLPVAATGDYGHVVLSAVSSEDYWPFDKTETGRGSLYEYSGTDNKEPILVGVEGGKGSTALIGLCGTQLGSQLGSTYNAISSDGESIFFTVFPGCGEPPKPTQAELYARLHGNLVSPAPAETVQISASECTTACGKAESGKNFEGASEDGQRVFFTSTQKLTNDAVDGTASGDATELEKGCPSTKAGGGGCNLYEYDFSEPEGARLKLVAGGEVLGVAGIAEDGSHVYFVSRAAIGSAGPNGNPPVEGEANLYVYDTQTAAVAFIATLGLGDNNDWSRQFAARPVEVGGEDGRSLLFASSTPGLTSGDTSEVTQLFEYRAEAEGEPAELVRVTKGEDGYNEDGNGVTLGVEAETIKSINEPLGNGNDFKSRTSRLNIADGGRTVFFAAPGGLSPRATSAALGCENLYEFHTDSDLSAGGVHLLSDGRDTQLYKGAFCGPVFQATDETGANMLFTTADPLIPDDIDGVQRDLYDARIGGGFASAPAGEPGLCLPGSCEGPTSPALGSPTLNSVNEPGEAPLPPPPTVTKKSVNKKKTSTGSNAAKLTRALRTCRGKTKRQRAACEHSAKRRYGSKAKAIKSSRRGSA